MEILGYKIGGTPDKETPASTMFELYILQVVSMWHDQLRNDSEPENVDNVQNQYILTRQ